MNVCRAFWAGLVGLLFEDNASGESLYFPMNGDP